MYTLEMTPYGLNLKLSGSVSVKMLEDLKVSIESKIQYLPIDPKVLFDVSDLKPLTRRVKKPYTDIFRMLMDCGMARSCVLFSSSVVHMQLKNISANLGFSEERYINITITPSYKRYSREWLVLGLPTSRETP